MIAVAAAVVALAPFSGAPGAPAVPPDSYRVRAEDAETTEIATIQSPGRTRIRALEPFPRLEVTRAGTAYIAPTSESQGAILRRLFAVSPDGFLPNGTDRHRDLVDSVLAQARGGSLQLISTSLAGRPAWLAEVPLPANECAGLPARSAQVWIAQRTLLPLRVNERLQSNSAVSRDTTYTYSYLLTRFSAATFAPPTLGRNPLIVDNGFIRATPIAAAGPLPYVPRVPTVLPPGFRVAVSGWARRSGITGPEGSIAASPWLFGVSYRRGQERIDITQRAARTDWPDSPFGAECQPLTTEAVTINGLPATFGIAPNTVPHLYWRDGNLRYTVSGPFPKDDLIAIAASLRNAGT